jgi:uncharacterized protein (TIGR03083 family)
MAGPDTARDLVDVRAALDRAGDRFFDLVLSAPDAGRPVPGSEWTVGDVAAHVALGTEAYAGFAYGAREPFVDVSDIAGGSLTRSSAGRLHDEPDRDLGALVVRARAALTSLLDSIEGRAGDEPVVWNGHEIALDAMVGLGLAEYLLHGRDVAVALHRPWPISPDDARLVLVSALPILPLLVNPATTRAVKATYDLRVRGGDRVTIAIDDGHMSVGPPRRSVDCHVSAEPVALLLVAYGRRTQWIPVLTGKLVAWGRKPWLGLRLVKYLVTP